MELDVFADQGFVILHRESAPINGQASVIFGAAGKFWSLRGNAPVPFWNPSSFASRPVVQ